MIKRAAVGVYVRRFLLGCVWSLAVVVGVVVADVAGNLHAALEAVLPWAAVFPAWMSVGAIHHVRYVRSRGEEPDARDYSRRPRRDLTLPGVDLEHALSMVRELDRDRVLHVGEQVRGGFVIRAARGGTWSRATAHVFVAEQGDGGGGGGGDGIRRVCMRIEGGIPFMQGTDDGRALLLVLQLRDHFIDGLRAHLISSPMSPREPERAGR